MDSLGVPTLAADHHHVRQQGQHSFCDGLENYPSLSVELSDIISISGLVESASPGLPKDNNKKMIRGSNRSQTNDDVVAPEQHRIETTEYSGKQKTRSAKMRNCYEKRRRDKIEARMKVLRDLIPNSQKLDKASLLDRAISHIKSLKQQLEVMQQMRWLFVPPSAMQFVPQLTLNTGTNADLSAFCHLFQPPWVAAGGFAPMPFLAPTSYSYSYSDGLRVFPTSM